MNGACIRPSAARGSAAGRLGWPAARRAWPVSASTENMTLASTGWLARELSTTRKMASGRPLTSASPRTRAFGYRLRLARSKASNSG